MATKRRRTSRTRLIEDAVDDAKDHGEGRRAEREMDDLKSALDDLTAKVNRLVALQAGHRKPGA